MWHLLWSLVTYSFLGSSCPFVPAYTASPWAVETRAVSYYTGGRMCFSFCLFLFPEEKGEMSFSLCVLHVKSRVLQCLLEWSWYGFRSLQVNLVFSCCSFQMVPHPDTLRVPLPGLCVLITHWHPQPWVGSSHESRLLSALGNFPLLCLRDYSPFFFIYFFSPSEAPSGQTFYSPADHLCLFSPLCVSFSLHLVEICSRDSFGSSLYLFHGILSSAIIFLISLLFSACS